MDLAIKGSDNELMLKNHVTGSQAVEVYPVVMEAVSEISTLTVSLENFDADREIYLLDNETKELEQVTSSITKSIDPKKNYAAKYAIVVQNKEAQKEADVAVLPFCFPTESTTGIFSASMQNESVSSMAVTSIEGVQLMTVQAASTLDLSTLENGTYVVSFLNADGEVVSSSKVIKK